MTDGANNNPYLKKSTAPKDSSNEPIDDAVPTPTESAVGTVPGDAGSKGLTESAESQVQDVEPAEAEAAHGMNFSSVTPVDASSSAEEPRVADPGVVPKVDGRSGAEIPRSQIHGANGTNADEAVAADGSEAGALDVAAPVLHRDSLYPASASGLATQLAEPQRVHRLTPFLQFWRTIIIGVLFAIFQILQGDLRLMREDIQGHFRGVLLGLGIALVVVVAVGTVFWFASGLWWRKISFTIDEDEVTVRRGLFSKIEKSARREKIQAVDVVEPLIPRVFGLAELRIETAGGSDSSLRIFYLEKHRAEILRAELTGQGVEPQNELPVTRTIAAAALESSWLILGVIVSLLTIPALLIPVLIGLVPSLWKLFDMSWRFTADIDDSLRITYGLANRRRQSIPLDRIHAVELSQPFLWRIPGWWRIRATAIGYETTSVILPVATLDEAKDFAAQLGVPLNDAPVAPTYRSPNRAKWVSPLAYKRQVVETGDFITIFGGRLIRRTATIRGIHIQELSLSQGPIQRKLRLKNLRLDLVRGAVQMTARDLDESDADTLLGILRRRETKLMNQ